MSHKQVSTKNAFLRKAFSAGLFALLSSGTMSAALINGETFDTKVRRNCAREGFISNGDINPGCYVVSSTTSSPTILADTGLDGDDQMVLAQLVAEAQQGGGPLISMLAARQGVDVQDIIDWALQLKLEE